MYGKRLNFVLNAAKENLKKSMTSVKTIFCKQVLVLSLFMLISVISKNLNANNFENKFYFDIQYSNLKTGQIFISYERKNKKLILTAKSMSEGFLSFFYNYQSHLMSESILYNNEWFPSSLIVKSFVNDEKRLSKVKWIDGKNTLRYEINPPLNLEKVFPIPKESLVDIIDPITAFLQIIQNIKTNKDCSGKYRIFDGRRRYDVISKKLGKFFLENDRPRSFRGQTVICGFKFLPIGGHRVKSKWKPENDKFTDVKIYFANVKENLIFPVRMTLTRWFGEIIVRLLNDDG